jgi:hypothetical protein
MVTLPVVSLLVMLAFLLGVLTGHIPGFFEKRGKDK